MKPYYQKFHSLRLPDEATKAHLGLDWSDDIVRGVSGPVQASFSGVIQDPISKAWVDTFKNLEYGVTGDPFSGITTGGYSNASTCDQNAERSYSASAYFAPAKERPNLRLLTGVLAERILLGRVLDEGAFTATGVIFSLHSQEYVILASKEVILAAGAIQTPKLLELSGIGNDSILEACGIPVILNNRNVGENLQDHLMTGISYEVKDVVVTGDGLLRQEPEIVQAALEAYVQHKAGPLASGGIGSHAFIPISQLSKDGHTPLDDLLDQYQPHSARERQNYHYIEPILRNPKEGYGAAFMFPAQVNLHAGPEVSSFLSNPQPGNFLSLGIGQSHPLSRGSVHITSSDASEPPIIDPRYLSNPLDLELLARQLLFIEELSQTEPLTSLLKPNGQRNHPSAYVGSSDLEAAKAYVKASAISSYHLAGTCAMFPRHRGGVVDRELMVYGTTNLRIVDASMIPFIPRGNIQSTVYAVAEKAADIIKDVHGLKVYVNGEAMVNGLGH